MKKFSLLIAMSVFALVSFAQKAEITFDKTVHDFGKVAEELGKVDCEFEFTNTGDAPLVLNNASSSCGCTVPSWTKEPIAPGGKGSIKVSYSAAGRPGAISKSVTVTSNATTPSVSLRIAGEVIARGKSAPYEFAAGASLRLRTNTVAFAKVLNGNKTTIDVDVMNVGQGAVKPVVEKLPSYITYTAIPAELGSNAYGKLFFNFDAATYGKLGNFSETLPVMINGSEVKITFSGNVAEDFSKVDRKTAPIFQTETRKISFGALKAGAKKTVKVKISNVGVNPLIIRSIDNKNPEITIKEPKAINGTKSDFLNITLNTAKKVAGNYKASFVIQTNDPINTFVTIEIDYQVTK